MKSLKITGLLLAAIGIETYLWALKRFRRCVIFPGN